MSFDPYKFAADRNFEPLPTAKSSVWRALICERNLIELLKSKYKYCSINSLRSQSIGCR